jgi:hypothetical protein
MPRLSRPTASLILAAALLSALDGWSRVAQLAGVSPQAAARPFLRPAEERRAALDADLAATEARRQRTKELAADVAEGRLELTEAAARLREMYRAVPDFPWQTVRRRFPGASDEECCCRLMMAEVEALLGPDSERARAVAPRLEAQLQQLLARQAGPEGAAGSGTG